MNEDVKGFGGIATGLARSPLGIIALFIVLVYGLAGLVLMVGRSTLTSGERLPLVWFLVLFPVLVLAVFTFLVGWKQDKLIWPSDFKDERNYLDYTRAIEAATSLAAASAKPGGGGGGVGEGGLAIGPIVAAVQAATGSSGAARARAADRRPRLLWVDDQPSNNTYERRAFEAVGIDCVTALSTEEAERAVAAQPFDVIVSDLRRPEGADAGLDLLNRLRAAGVKSPYFIYAGSRAAGIRGRVLTEGGNGATNNPQELFELVTAAVFGKP